MNTTRARESQVRELVEPVVAREGYELVDVELTADRGRAILRLYIDTIPPGTRERGISVDDCSNVSRVISDLLDIEDLMPGEYNLEVSSPGLFRPLTKREHYDRALGERVKVKTFDKVDGRRVFIGKLVKREDSRITVDVDKTEHVIELEQVAKANLEPEL